MKPRSFREGMLAMPSYFNPRYSEGINAVIQFEITGSEPGTWHFDIRDNQCTLKEGKAESLPTLTIKTSSQVWLEIMRGELNGPEAFLMGRASAHGDIQLLLNFGKLFSQY